MYQKATVCRVWAQSCSELQHHLADSVLRQLLQRIHDVPQRHRFPDVRLELIAIDLMQKIFQNIWFFHVKEKIIHLEKALHIPVNQGLILSHSILQSTLVSSRLFSTHFSFTGYNFLCTWKHIVNKLINNGEPAVLVHHSIHCSS